MALLAFSRVLLLPRTYGSSGAVSFLYSAYRFFLFAQTNPQKLSHVSSVTTKLPLVATNIAIHKKIRGRTHATVNIGVVFYWFLLYVFQYVPT